MARRGSKGLASALLLLASCHRDSPERALVPAEEALVAPRLDPAAADRPARLVAVLPSRVEQCPPIDGAVAGAPLLGRYCQYQRADGGAFAAVPVLEGVDLAFDRVAVTPMQETAVRSALDGLWEATLNWGSGMPERLDTPADLTRVRPRLVLLDSYPDTCDPVLDEPLCADMVDTDVPDADRGTHGLRMVVLAAQLTCSDGTSCPVQVASRQVLGQPAVQGEPVDPTWGAFFDLADGIVETVDDWLAVRTAPEGLSAVGQLVLNLSLAWHPVYGGGIPDGVEIAAEGEEVALIGGGTAPFSWSELRPESFPPGIRAVWDALAYARCHDALVFAAAGNRTAGPLGTRGPLLPAAWEAVPATQLPPCDGLRAADLDASRVPFPEPDQPLVVAVGAVGPRPPEADTPDSSGDFPDPGREVSEVFSARPDARPAFLAFGYQMVHGQPPSVLNPGAALTGTSVATVIVSSTAALLASDAGTVDPMGILRHLAQTPAPRQDPWGEDARHSSGLLISPAFQESAGRYGLTDGAAWIRPCGVLDPSLGWSCGAPQYYPQEVALDALPEATVEVDWVSEDEPGPSERWYSPSLQPTILEQPDETLCPECTLEARTGALHLRFAMPGADIEQMTLRVRLTDGTISGPMDVPVSALQRALDEYGTEIGGLDATVKAVTGLLPQVDAARLEIQTLDERPDGQERRRVVWVSVPVLINVGAGG